MTTDSAAESDHTRSLFQGPKSRVDFDALGDRRFLAMLPMVLFALSLPFIARALEPAWINATDIAKFRMFARFCVSFVLLGCYPAVLVLVRLGIAEVRSGEHRMLLAVYPALTTTWQCVVAIDGFLLVAWTDKFSLPIFPMDLGLSIFSAAALPFILHHKAWFYGFEPKKLLDARMALENAPIGGSPTPIDTLDYRVLQLLARSGSDVANVMINDIGVGHRDLMLRLAKLTALGYVELVSELHGSQVVLTTQATDTLALPISLFVWNTEDKATLAELASARLSLEAREPQKVVVACARLCEAMLKRLISKIEPKVTHVGGKELSKATLGELVQVARQHKRIGKFEDSLFSAINERRKKIHSREGEAPIDDSDAFALYTLTEMVAREVLRNKGETVD
ncbi:MAG TPA: hypothetical protein PK156_38125 [Polyangium sp.]|nr:hypothetical protein [Polyangium sp.]